MKKVRIYKSLRLNRTVLAVFLSVCILSVSLLCFQAINDKNSAAAQGGFFSDRTLIIDAGHGGIDGGAVAADGSEEQIINLKISKKLQELLTFFGYHVIMTRETENSIHSEDAKTIREQKKTDMHHRLDIMKQTENAVFISIHQNTSPHKSASGSVVYYSKNDPGSMVLANSIQDSVVAQLQPENQRTCVEAKSNLFLLYKAVCPAVLVECGFLSNGSELHKLQSDEYQNRLCLAIAQGIMQYLQTV